MRSLVVVIGFPLADLDLCINQRSKQRVIKAFIAEPSVETLDKRILGWFAWGDIMPFDAAALAPFENRNRRQFGTVVRDDSMRLAAPGHHSV